MAETFIPPSSSHIASISYDPNEQTMDVEFDDASVYSYFNVPVEVYRQWCSTGGGGEYFHRNIKNRFAYEAQ